MYRRNFLRAAAGATALGTMHFSSSMRSALAIDPFDRPKPGKLQLSLAAYSLRKYLAPSKDESKKMDLFDFVDFCFQQGIAGTELTSYYFPNEVTREYLLKLKNHCHLRGLTISGGAIRNDFCQADAEKVEADLAHTRTWVDHYALLGAPAIRIFAGNQPKDEDIQVTLQRCAKHCETAAKYAAEKGIMLALEIMAALQPKPRGYWRLFDKSTHPVLVLTSIAATSGQRMILTQN